MQDGDSGLGQTKLDGRCRIGCHRLERPVARDSLTLQERWQRGVGARRALGLLWQWSWMLGWQNPPPVLTGEKYICVRITTKYIYSSTLCFPGKNCQAANRRPVRVTRTLRTARPSPRWNGRKDLGQTGHNNCNKSTREKETIIVHSALQKKNSGSQKLRKMF